MHESLDDDVVLPPEQCVVIWSMRIWVTGVHHAIGAGDRLRTVFGGLGAEDAVPYLDAFMLALGQGAKRTIRIHCACHERVEPDERILLDLLTFAQQGRVLEARLLLRGLVHEAAAAEVLRRAQGLGIKLAWAGQFLDGCRAGRAEGEAAMTERVSATLH